MGAIKSKSSYQVEKEEKKKGVVEQPKRSSNKQEARNTLQMKEEVKNNILEAEQRFSTIPLQNEIETKSAENINKTTNEDAANSKIVQSPEEKPSNNIDKDNKEKQNEENKSKNDNTENEKESETNNDNQAVFQEHPNDHLTDITLKDCVANPEVEDTTKEKHLESIETPNLFEDKPKENKIENVSKTDNDTQEICELGRNKKTMNKTVQFESTTTSSSEEIVIPNDKKVSITESNSKESENIPITKEDDQKSIELNNQADDSEVSKENIIVIDVHHPIDAKESEENKNCKDEKQNSEIKIENYKIDVQNNEKHDIKTIDLNKIEVYRQDDASTEEIKLHHQSVHKTKIEDNKNDIKFDVEVYTYKEDNQEKIMEIEEASIHVTTMESKSEELKTEKSDIQLNKEHEVEEKNLKLSDQEITSNKIISYKIENAEVANLSTTNTEKESKGPQIEHTDKSSEGKIDPFVKITKIHEEIKTLKEQVIHFSGTTVDKEYLTLKEMLVECMIKLDDIAVADNDELRNERKKVIKFAQDTLETLNRNVVQATANSEDDSDSDNEGNKN